MRRRAPRGVSLAFLAAPTLQPSGRSRPVRPLVGGLLLAAVIVVLLLAGAIR